MTLQVATEEDRNDRLSPLYIGPEKLLSLFSERDWSQFCLSYLLTDRDYSGVLGLAWEGRPGESHRRRRSQPAAKLGDDARGTTRSCLKRHETFGGSTFSESGGEAKHDPDTSQFGSERTNTNVFMFCLCVGLRGRCVDLLTPPHHPLRLPLTVEPGEEVNPGSGTVRNQLERFLCQDSGGPTTAHVCHNQPC